MKLHRSIILILAIFGLISLSVIGSQLDEAQAQPAKPAATPTPPISEEEGVVKVDTEAVNVLFTAQDKNRRLLLTLKPADFQIYENGQLQTISGVSRQVDLTLSLSILIDTSMSQARTLPEDKSEAISFLEVDVRP